MLCANISTLDWRLRRNPYLPGLHSSFQRVKPRRFDFTCVVPLGTSTDPWPAETVDISSDEIDLLGVLIDLYT